jgi:hypothetical protein
VPSSLLRPFFLPSKSCALEIVRLIRIDADIDISLADDSAFRRDGKSSSILLEQFSQIGTGNSSVEHLHVKPSRLLHLCAAHTGGAWSRENPLVAACKNALSSALSGY